MRLSIVVVVLAAAAILAPLEAQADRLRFGAGDPQAQQVAEPAPVRGDPDVPTRPAVARPQPRAHAQGPSNIILSPCSMCEDSNGNAAGACMLCGVMRRFAALGGW